MPGKLEGRRIAVLCTDGVEQVELTQPLEAVRGAGAVAEVVSLEAGELTAFHHLDRADTFRVDTTVADADASDYDALVLPGGVANPDALRTDEAAVRFVRAFFEQAKPVAAICHAPWMLVEADVVRGRTVTSWPSLRTDLENAGARWIDDAVVVDEGLVTSRRPDDLPRFCKGLVETFAEGMHEGQRASVRASA